MTYELRILCNNCNKSIKPDLFIITPNLIGFNRLNWTNMIDNRHLCTKCTEKNQW